MAFHISKYKIGLHRAAAEQKTSMRGYRESQRHPETKFQNVVPV
ncbi:MAG: hypothetical protein QXQ81_07700 [Candidatus Thorarchaeota archaeon]